jgi:tRNA threonylcarbamoyladenosine biosynthesis protein TsaB
VNILAFDTSTIACSVALYLSDPAPDGQIFSAHELCPMQHTAMVLPMIQSLLDAAGITLDQLDAIAFGCGPGSFTGIRIAASLAQGLAFAKSLPVIPVSSLVAAAQAAYMAQGYERILVAVDARMDQIYWGAYQLENGLMQPVIPDELSLPAAITQVSAANWCGVGDGWRVYGEILTEKLQFQPHPINDAGLPSAAAILPIAIERFKRRDWVGPADALPVYLR